MRKPYLLSMILLAATASGPGCSSDSGAPAEADDDFPLPLAGGLAPTPPMGWNSWNKFQCNINEDFIRRTADAMVSTGMKDVGYQYINIDDCWSIESAARAADGSLQVDPNRFPSGMQALADYVRGKGLKLGIYGDRGSETCAHRAGSAGHELQDAATFAAWGIEYLKYDNCPDPGPNPGLIIQPQFQAMRDALDAATVPIVYSVCAWSFYEWAGRMGDLQRTTTDIRNEWPSIVSNLKSNQAVAAYGGPNQWNDPDMLEVGNSDNGAGTVTDVENQSHFSLWAIVASPLIAGNNLFDPNMSAATKTILTNTEIIAINQDALGLQGVRIWEDGTRSLWGKPLNANGARAAVLFNEGADAADMTVKFVDLGLAAGRASVRDLQAHTDLGTFSDSFTINVASHGTATLKIVGNEPPRPKGSAFLSDQTPIYAANGLGPVERDSNNGATGAGDGTPIKIRGETFAKGLGTAAPAAVIYRLGGKCRRFSATVGIDDVTAGQGSARFQVIADGAVLYDSQNLTGTSPAAVVDVDITGKRRLKLYVTNADDGMAQDRASWGDAKVECEP
jgi:alpha-galactosidase